MANIKDKVAEAGHTAAETAKSVGHKIAEGAEKAVDYVKDKVGAGSHATAVKDRMEVIASCGKKVGVVDHVEGGAIKLTKNDSKDGHATQLLFVPEVCISPGFAIANCIGAESGAKRRSD